MKTIRILYVEDDVVDQRAFQRLVKARALPYQYAIAGSVVEARRILAGQAFDVVIADHDLDDGTALDVLGSAGDAAAIVVTGHGNEEVAVQAMKAGAADYLVKDLDYSYFKLLPLTVEKVLAQRAADTARRDAEAAPHSSEEYFRSLIENASDLIAILGHDGVIQYASPSHRRVLGYEPEEMVGRAAVEFIHPDDVPALTEAMVRARADPRAVHSLAFRERHKDGSWRYMEASGTVLPTRPGAAVVNARDVTERAQAEAVLREREEHFRSLFEHATDMIYTHDLEGRYTWVNAAAERLTGYTRAELLSMDVMQLVAPSSLRLEDGYTPGRYDMNILTKDGRDVSVEVAAQLLLRDGQPVGWQGIARDVTQRMRLEAELQRAKEGAEAAAQARGDFLAHMSHEIRTPMNGVLGMIELALDTPLTTEQREYLELAGSSAIGLLRVINDVLDFSKIEAGKLDVDRVPFGLRASLRETLKPLAGQARQRGVELRTEVDAAVPDDLVGDPMRLRQVVINLVGNALKFTERGHVAVAVKPVRQQADAVTLHFRVEDTGIGIPPEKQAAIFEAFEQSDGSVTRKFGGTGLGLSIASKLVGLMGGRMWVEGAVGEGSKFHFTVRLTVSPTAVLERDDSTAADRVPQPSVPIRRLHVLLAEDNAVNQRLAVRLLEKRGHTVVVAATGADALAAWERERFDLVLMDVQMPEMDGYEATRAIRARERDAGVPHVPIIAMTAHAMKSDEERCRSAGMDAYVSKPFRPAELFAALRDAVSDER